MSRIGKHPITVPAGVEVKVDGSTVTVKGPKGTLTKEFKPSMKITAENGEIKVERPDDEAANRALHGLTRTLINNMVIGVTEGYKKQLEINGVGYRCQKQGKDLMIGFNPKFLIDALRVIEDETVDIYLVNPKAPCFIRDKDGSYIYLVLPVNFTTVD